MEKFHLEIRRAEYPQDYPSLAAVQNDTEDWQTTVEDLMRHDRNRDPKHHSQRFVAEIIIDNQKIIVGKLLVAHDDFSFEAGKYTIRINVLKTHQNFGIGSALYITAQNHLLQLGDAVKLQTMCNDYELPALHLLEKHGFVQVWERIESRLEPKEVDFTKYASLYSILAQAEIELFRFSSFPPETRVKQLYDLDLELILDVPFGQTTTPEPFELWQKNFLEDPENNPETIWIAVKNQQWIAFTSLGKQKDHFYIGMTGVKKEFRGLGIAKALKLEGVRYALNSGLEIRTMNDNVNTAMLAMNFSMGFKRHHSRLRFEKNT
ncbi:MAG: hypothetical protein RLZZ156_1350 [Deinococcota bacterium]|jgi:ribosomal protein S18 acetylase RimI-like enzyme